MSTSEFRIERGTDWDVPVILNLIKQLAEFEKLGHEVLATEDILRQTLFGDKPAAEVLLAHAGDTPAGFALFFTNFSTFLGRPGLYLEDLFVVPEYRGQGLGRRLMAHLANIAVERGYGRMEWSVLDWNSRAIEFYKSLGARPMDEWTVFRVTGDGLTSLAGS